MSVRRRRQLAGPHLTEAVTRSALSLLQLLSPRLRRITLVFLRELVTVAVGPGSRAAEEPEGSGGGALALVGQARW
jgi:hypothetical protein